MTEENKQLFLNEFLRNNPSIKFIRYQWIDYTGILRARVVTTSYCRKLVLGSSPLPMSPVALTSTTINEFMPDLVPTGVDHIHPDFSSLRPCLYAPGHASVMCFVNEGIGNFEFRRCPRTLLSNVVASGTELDIKIGFEVEFQCLHTDGTILEDCMEGWSTTAGLRNRCLPVIEEIVDILERVGIEVCQFHTEGTQGMFEISTGPLPVLQSVDAYVYTRETIKTLFAKHGIISTMHPSPTPEHHGIGAHIHLSISSSEPTCDSFLAGMLSCLPALCAFSLPLEESYKRVNDFESEAGAYVAWGTQNRDVPIRKIRTGHWELRCCDGAANMYLVLAAFIAAGIEGSRASKELTWKDCPNNPSCEDEEGRNLWCIDKKLPTGLQESLSALKEKELGWRESGFDQAAIRYAQIKNQEMVDLHELGDDKKRALMIRYF